DRVGRTLRVDLLGLAGFSSQGRLSYLGGVMDQGTNEMATQGTERKKRKALSAETKYEIFLETSRKDVPAAEVLRRYGLHTSDLQRIREKVRRGALKELGGAERGGAVNPASEAVRRLSSLQKVL